MQRKPELQRNIAPAKSFEAADHADCDDEDEDEYNQRDSPNYNYSSRKESNNHLSDGLMGDKQCQLNCDLSQGGNASSSSSSRKQRRKNRNQQILITGAGATNSNNNILNAPTFNPNQAIMGT